MTIVAPFKEGAVPGLYMVSRRVLGSKKGSVPFNTTPMVVMSRRWQVSMVTMVAVVPLHPTPPHPSASQQLAHFVSVFEGNKLLVSLT